MQNWILQFGETYVEQKLELTHRYKDLGRIKSTTLGFLKSAIERDFVDEALLAKARAVGFDRLQQSRGQMEQQLYQFQKTLRRLEADFRAAMSEKIENEF